MGEDQNVEGHVTPMDYIKAAIPFLQWATAVGVAAWFANNVVSALDSWSE